MLIVNHSIRYISATPLVLFIHRVRLGLIDRPERLGGRAPRLEKNRGPSAAAKLASPPSACVTAKEGLGDTKINEAAEGGGRGS